MSRATEEEAVEGLGDEGLADCHKPTKHRGHLRRSTKPLGAPLRSEAEVWQDRELLLSSSGGGHSPGRGQLGHLASEKVQGLHAPGPHQIRAGKGVSLPKLSPSPGVPLLSLSHKDYRAPSHPQRLSSQTHHMNCVPSTLRDLFHILTALQLGCIWQSLACPSLTAFFH